MDNITHYIENFIKKNNDKKKTLFEIRVGKLINDYKFNLNINNIFWYNLIKDIKKITNSDNIKYYKYKKYCYRNLQLDSHQNGIQKCSYKKPKDILDITLKNYDYDIKVIANRISMLPSHIFPNKLEYNFEQFIESIVIDNNKLFKIIFSHCEYQDKTSSNQVTIQINGNHIKNYTLLTNNILNIIKAINIK